MIAKKSWNSRTWSNVFYELFLKFRKNWQVLIMMYLLYSYLLVGPAFQSTINSLIFLALFLFRTTRPILNHTLNLIPLPPQRSHQITSQKQPITQPQIAKFISHITDNHQKRWNNRQICARLTRIKTEVVNFYWFKLNFTFRILGNKRGDQFYFI